VWFARNGMRGDGLRSSSSEEQLALERPRAFWSLIGH